jgi:hypothetical protein
MSGCVLEPCAKSIRRHGIRATTEQPQDPVGLMLLSASVEVLLVTFRPDRDSTDGEVGLSPRLGLFDLINLAWVGIKYASSPAGDLIELPGIDWVGATRLLCAYPGVNAVA